MANITQVGQGLVWAGEPVTCRVLSQTVTGRATGFAALSQKPQAWREAQVTPQSCQPHQEGTKVLPQYLLQGENSPDPQLPNSARRAGTEGPGSAG